MCGPRIETVSHTVSECGKLAQNEYKQRHGSVGRYVSRQFCEKLGFNRARLWYEHEPESVVQNKSWKILWESIEHVQKSSLLRTARIIRKVLSG